MMSSSANKKAPKRRVTSTAAALSEPLKQPDSVARLLESLQKAQNKPSAPISTKGSSSSTRSSGDSKKTTSEDASVKNPIRNNRKKSVAAQMQQPQAATDKTSKNVLSGVSNSNPTQSKRSRQVSVSNPPQSQAPRSRIPVDVLEDLDFRFISNMHELDKRSKIRICFQVELAHWYYCDFYVENSERRDCPGVNIKEFTRLLFSHCNELRRYANHVDEIINEWRDYKSNVPTYGAILLDDTLNNVLLVQGYYASKNSWGFPKGKVNQNEPPRDCAVREVREETGFDFSTLPKHGKKFQKFINDTMVRLYVVPGVPYEFPFAPETRKEIRKIQWFNIFDLPADRGETSGALKGNNFYTVTPFVNDLQKYIRKEQEKRAKNKHDPTKYEDDRLQQLRAAIGVGASSQRNPLRYSHQVSTEPSSAAVVSTPLDIPPVFSQLFPSLGPQPKNDPASDLLYDSPSKLIENCTTDLYTPITNIPTRLLRAQPDQGQDLSRPKLPDISPNVSGIDALGTLGLCTPIKPGVNPFPHMIALATKDPQVPQSGRLEKKTAPPPPPPAPQESVPVHAPLDPLVIHENSLMSQASIGSDGRGFRRALNFGEHQEHHVANVASLLSPQDIGKSQLSPFLLSQVPDGFTPINYTSHGFAMPTVYQHPMVTAAHPGGPQSHSVRANFPAHNAPTQEVYSATSTIPHVASWYSSSVIPPNYHQNPKVANAVSHADFSMLPLATSSPIEPRRPAQPTPPPLYPYSRERPIHPQAIVPVAASPTAIGFAEAPKRSSRISLSDSSAFTAIPKQSSVAKATAPPPSPPLHSSPDVTSPLSAKQLPSRPSRHSFGSNKGSAKGTPTKSNRGRNLTPLAVSAAAAVGARNAALSMGSPASSVRTATSPAASSQTASLQELSMIGRESLADRQVVDLLLMAQPYHQQNSVVTPTTPTPLDLALIKIRLGEAWKRPFKLDLDSICGPPEVWDRAFVFNTGLLSQ